VDTLFVTEASMNISSPAQFKAMGHPLRQRLLFLLGEPATISQLASRLGIAKGSISHHLKVLRDAGMVEVSETRQVRGGTEQYYRRAAARLDIATKAPAPTAAMLEGFGQELIAAQGEPLLVLRHVRLTPATAEKLRDALYELATDIDTADEPAARYGLLIGMYEERA
jgi:DNA-binding transcriptional ArsR family regulator